MIYIFGLLQYITYQDCPDEPDSLLSRYQWANIESLYSFPVIDRSSFTNRENQLKVEVPFSIWRFLAAQR